MRLTYKLLIALLLFPAFLVTSPAFAQQASVVDAGALSQALAGKADTEAEQRALVGRVLDRANVREMAARLGLNVEQASAAVATLSGAELGVLAERAGAVETEALAGGASTIVISTTTLLLVLIIVILLAN
jgi:hypothetical protein